MDTKWFIARRQTLGLRQDDIGAALGMDRSTYSRLENGGRPMAFEEMEPLAKILQVPVIEIVAHAYEWSVPIRNQTVVRADLLEIALACALEAMWQNPAALDPELARQAAGIYGLLQQAEERGESITSNEAARRLIVDTIRTMSGTLRPPASRR
jgi:transcriptional regulator with XRE-family HTH domain